MTIPTNFEKYCSSLVHGKAKEKAEALKYLRENILEDESNLAQLSIEAWAKLINAMVVHNDKELYKDNKKLVTYSQTLRHFIEASSRLSNSNVNLKDCVSKVFAHCFNSLTHNHGESVQLDYLKIMNSILSIDVYRQLLKKHRWIKFVRMATVSIQQCVDGESSITGLQLETIKLFSLLVLVRKPIDDKDDINAVFVSFSRLFAHNLSKASSWIASLLFFLLHNQVDHYRECFEFLEQTLSYIIALLQSHDLHVRVCSLHLLEMYIRMNAAPLLNVFDLQATLCSMCADIDIPLSPSEFLYTFSTHGQDEDDEYFGVGMLAMMARILASTLTQDSLFDKTSKRQKLSNYILEFTSKTPSENVFKLLIAFSIQTIGCFNDFKLELAETILSHDNKDWGFLLLAFIYKSISPSFNTANFLFAECLENLSSFSHLLLATTLTDLKLIDRESMRVALRKTIPERSVSTNSQLVLLVKRLCVQGDFYMTLEDKKNILRSVSHVASVEHLFEDKQEEFHRREFNNLDKWKNENFYFTKLLLGKPDHLAALFSQNHGPVSNQSGGKEFDLAIDFVLSLNQFDILLSCLFYLIYIKAPNEFVLKLYVKAVELMDNKSPLTVQKSIQNSFKKYTFSKHYSNDFDKKLFQLLLNYLKVESSDGKSHQLKQTFGLSQRSFKTVAVEILIQNLSDELKEFMLDFLFSDKCDLSLIEVLKQVSSEMFEDVDDLDQYLLHLKQSAILTDEHLLFLSSISNKQIARKFVFENFSSLELPLFSLFQDDDNFAEYFLATTNLCQRFSIVRKYFRIIKIPINTVVLSREAAYLHSLARDLNVVNFINDETTATIVFHTISEDGEFSYLLIKEFLMKNKNLPRSLLNLPNLNYVDKMYLSSSTVQLFSDLKQSALMKQVRREIIHGTPTLTGTDQIIVLYELMNDLKEKASESQRIKKVFIQFFHRFSKQPPAVNLNCILFALRHPEIFTLNDNQLMLKHFFEETERFTIERNHRLNVYMILISTLVQQKQGSSLSRDHVALIKQNYRIVYFLLHGSFCSDLFSQLNEWMVNSKQYITSVVVESLFQAFEPLIIKKQGLNEISSMVEMLDCGFDTNKEIITRYLCKYRVYFPTLHQRMCLKIIRFDSPDRVCKELLQRMFRHSIDTLEPARMWAFRSLYTINDAFYCVNNDYPLVASQPTDSSEIVLPQLSTTFCEEFLKNISQCVCKKLLIHEIPPCKCCLPLLFQLTPRNFNETFLKTYSNDYNQLIIDCILQMNPSDYDLNLKCFLSAKSPQHSLYVSSIRNDDPSRQLEYLSQLETIDPDAKYCQYFMSNGEFNVDLSERLSLELNDWDLLCDTNNFYKQLVTDCNNVLTEDYKEQMISSCVINYQDVDVIKMVPYKDLQNVIQVLTTVVETTNLNKDYLFQLLFEESIKQKHTQRAFQCLQILPSKVNKAKYLWLTGDQLLAIQLLKSAPNYHLLQAEWSSEAKFQPLQALINNFQQCSNEDGKSHFKFAEFCHRRLLEIQSSKALSRIKELNMHATISTNKQVKNHQIKRQMLDKQQLALVEQEKLQLLQLAIEQYCLCLLSSDLHNNCIFQLFQLIISHPLNSHGLEILSRISSWKFIPVSNQMISHHNLKPLVPIMNRLILQHPHHCLHHLLCRSPADLSAFNLFPIQKEVDEMRLLFQALDELAISAADSLTINNRLRSVKNFSHVQVLTATIPVDKEGNYRDLIYVKSYQQRLQILNGINRPKKLICIGSDNRLYPQLIKGKDDLRQDAILQQIFQETNHLFHSCQSSNRHQLSIRTFVVKPVTSQSGVIEFLDDCLPLGDYLTSGYQRLEKSNADSWSPEKCRSFMKKAFETNKSSLQTFEFILHKSRPLMRRLFLLQFPDPVDWFNCRLRFTRELACSSIMCHILGIGDRHPNNIMISSRKLSIVHIDFGLAFEQSHLLPLPELVPFRLTQNLVDGMSVCGMNGPFRKSMEYSMQVLVDNRSLIFTLLQVLKINAKVDQGTALLADRALVGVEQKLNTSLNVASTVNQLIYEAMDKERLCRMYYGWQPFL